jgi:hypothetical protein
MVMFLIHSHSLSILIVLFKLGFLLLYILGWNH